MLRWKQLDRTTKVLALVTVLAHLVAVVGVLLVGIDFLVRPIPLLNETLIRLWLCTNGLMSLAAGVMVARNIVHHRRWWTWQEITMSRGLFFVLFGGGVAYFARSLLIETPVITFGTPFVSLGLMMIIYAAVGSPVRFDREDP